MLLRGGPSDRGNPPVNGLAFNKHYYLGDCFSFVLVFSLVTGKIFIDAGSLSVNIANINPFKKSARPHYSRPNMSERNTEIESTTSPESKSKVKPPSLYKVLLHNDDYTSMEFVVEILQHVFRKQFEEATMIMLNVHRSGIGICGMFTHEIAETKVDLVHNLAQERGFPLKCTMEKE